MKLLLTTLCILIIATVSFAAKPVIESNGVTPSRIVCPFGVTTYDWNFQDGDHGFVPTACDTSGEAVWAYGQDLNFGESVNLWATVLDGDYPSDAGEALVSPSFLVDDTTKLVQLTHYYHTENSYDGMNLMVAGTVVAPLEGYVDDEISDSSNYYAFCVDGQPGFTGGDLEEWVMITSCFDLSQFMGQEVDLSFQFGSDGSITRPGWYLGAVAVGGPGTVATEEIPWDSMKAMYR